MRSGVAKTKKPLVARSNKVISKFGVVVFALIAITIGSYEPSLAAADHVPSHESGHEHHDDLPESGIESSLSLTSIYQANVRGGLSTHKRRGRHSGSYDLEITGDTQKLLGIENGTLYVHAEGWWPDSVGIDEVSVGSTFGVNGDAGPRDALVVTELWWEQAFADGAALLRVGKLDLTGGFECRGCAVSFDGSNYANDETSQFLNGALINNPSIPFPTYGIGAVLLYEPEDSWYASVGAADAQADTRETGFSTAFHGEDYFFYILETGVTPRFGSPRGLLQGAYRVGLWNDPQPKANSDESRSSRDDIGVYLSCDQAVFKENADPEDGQGLGLFARFGYAPSETNDVTNFFSFGLQYQGLIEPRDQDVLGVGFARGIFADSADFTYTENHESVLEVYYNASITPRLNLSPSLQYLTNPGGSDAGSDSVVFGVRAQMTF